MDNNNIICKTVIQSNEWELREVQGTDPLSGFHTKTSEEKTKVDMCLTDRTLIHKFIRSWLTQFSDLYGEF